MVGNDDNPGRNAVRMDDVWASYDARSTILREVNLRIKAGTNYAIVGLSGSGKSTLLKLMNGMMVPARGTILVEDHKPNQRNGQFRKIMSKMGYIPQSLGLVRNSSVLDNVMMGALPRMKPAQFLLKRYSEENLEEARRILDRVGLLGKEGRKAYMLSGGEILPDPGARYASSSLSANFIEIDTYRWQSVRAECAKPFCLGCLC